MSARDAGARLGAAPTRTHADEATLDQLFAEPIVQQLMRRDGIDERLTRNLLTQAAAARAVSPMPGTECRSKRIVRRLQQIVGLPLKQIRTNGWLKLIGMITGVKKNLSDHKAGPVKRGDPL